MLSLHMGAAGSPAAAAAMAAYMLEQQIPTEAILSAAYYGQTSGTEEAIAAGHGTAPAVRPDVSPELAEALGLVPGEAVTAETLAHILSGRRGDGEALPVQQQHQEVRTYGEGEDGAAVRHRVAYLDLTLSSGKDFSLAWAFAETEAERNSLLQAHRTAVAETMAYIEDQVIRIRLGDGGKDGIEAARVAYIGVEHYTARPTLEVARHDPVTGEVYTALQTVKIAGDPQIHTHVLVPNLVQSESGRFASMDTAAFHGRIHEFGAVHEAVVGRELRKLGVEVELNEKTHLLRIPAIPEAAVEEFSKRSRDGEREARKLAEAEGRDWGTLTPEQQAAFRKVGTHATRHDKETNTPDMQSWRAQAERIGWKHRSVIAAGGPAVPGSRAERMDHADRAALPHLAEMLSKRAVIGQGDARLAAARGFIAAGIENTDDVGAMMRHWAKGSVHQDGKWTKLMWREGARNSIKLTTELHRDQEAELIALARAAAQDRRHSLAPEAISGAVARSGVTYAGRTGEQQRAAVEALGTDGALGVMIGSAGVGKTFAVLPPLVRAWEAQGMEVHGVAQAWRQAKELEGAGISHARTRALQPFLDGVREGRTRLGQDSVVVLDELGQIGTRQLLDLLRMRAEHGFKLVALGDDKQAQSIEAGPVIELLRRAVGEERIPQILDTIRQRTERERKLATMFRDGRAGEAIAAKRATGNAELVAGGYREAVERVADLYAAKHAEAGDRPGYRISISAPTNADAREISRAVRERRRSMGEVGPDLATVQTTDGHGGAQNLDLAQGDKVRLYARTRGVFTLPDGRRTSSVAGDNGSVLEVVAVDPALGLTLRTAKGKQAFVSWEALRDKGGTGRLLLAHGDVLTIDSSQGITSDLHINAMPSGSAGITAFKAYVAESRHVEETILVGSMGAEMREVQAWRMSGLPESTRQQDEADAWANMARNLERQPVKESALAFLEKAVVSKREDVKVMQSGLRAQEARQAEGLDAVTPQSREVVQQVQAAAPALVEAVKQISEARAKVAEQVAAAVPAAASRPAERVQISELEAQQQFLDAMRLHGLKPKGLPILDGKLHYCPVEGNKGTETSGAYKGFYEGRRPAGAIYNYKQGGWVGSWKADGEGKVLSAEELAALSRQAAEVAAARNQERAEREDAGAAAAKAILAGAGLADDSHPYLQAKGVPAIGLFVAAPGQTVLVRGEDGVERRHAIGGRLIVPLRSVETGELRNVQTIAADGTKLYLAGAQKAGTALILGDVRAGEPIAVAEGYATAATVHVATDMAVAMALDTSNLGPVARELRRQDAGRALYMAADNDHHLPLREKPLPNAGKEKAEKIAADVGAVVLLPDPVPLRVEAGKGTDWNDAAAHRGIDAVAAIIRSGMTEAAMSRFEETQRAVLRPSAGI